MDKEIFELQIKIIINKNLYRKNIIDEMTFSKVNDLLLKKLKVILV